MLALAVAQPAPGGAPPVTVALDMDVAAPGRQWSIEVLPCTDVVEGVSVWISDPLGTRLLWSIGYLGGIDRGLALGHVPGVANRGAVVGLTAEAGAPVNPGNSGWLMQAPFLDPAFPGPEVQYVEFGAAVPAAIPAAPTGPVFTVDILLRDAQHGDAFHFHLLDFVAVWSGGDGTAGAFSAARPFPALDTGGDAVPDGTVSLHGIDLDAPVPAPPAAWPVDFVDGPPRGGAALVRVAALPADVDHDGVVDVADLVAVITRWGAARGPADVNGDGTVDVLDLIEIVLHFGPAGCG
jgi:hypothetical protein